jgi:hypothetical protein
MAGRVEALIEPELLIWARKHAGFDVDVAAWKANVSAPVSQSGSEASGVEAWSNSESSRVSTSGRFLSSTFRSLLATSSRSRTSALLGPRNGSLPLLTYSPR